MQRACAQSTTWPSARGPRTSLPLPVHLFGLLQIQGLQLHGGCGPLFWFSIVQQSQDGSSGLVKCLREIFLHRALQTNYRQMADLNSRPRRHDNCCQTGVSTTASHLLHLPTQMGAPSSASRPASAFSWTTLARTARSTSTNFKEACFKTTTPLTAIPVYSQHK